jgi:uncharacterized protein (DUF1330 family)
MSMAAHMRENGEPMKHERVVALAVADHALYARYRTEMTPLLEAAGGGFRHDFEVSRDLKPDGDPAINRVFVISFPNKTSMDAFFADPIYKEIRARLFEKAVARTISIAEYDV